MRKEAGFATAYSFYHDNGGAPVLKVSYRNYLSMEQGKILPTFGRLSRIIFGLRFISKSAPANTLVVAWLKTMAGEEAYGNLLEPIISVKAVSGLSPLHKAMARSLSEKKFFITRERAEVVYANRTNYMCFMALGNDTAEWDPEDLAKKLGLNKQAMKKSLCAMEAVKLVKRLSNGNYVCPLATSHVEFPTLRTAPLCDKAHERMAELVASGKTIYFRRGVIRADLMDLRNFLPLMDLNITTSLTYSITKRTDQSALFAIEGRVIKLMDF